MDAKRFLDETMIRVEWMGQALDICHARQCGSDSFTESDLSNLWTGKLKCPYETPIYREAWHRGLLSVSCWFLMTRIGEMAETMEFSPRKAFEAMLDRGGIEGWQPVQAARKH